MPDHKITLDQLESLDYWQRLNPSLHISDRPFSTAGESYQFQPAVQPRLRCQMIEEGYITSPVILNEADIRVLSRLIVRHHESGIMPLFAAIYDEFWQTLHRLSQVLTPILGPDYRLVPDFWVWHVAAADNQSGWAPHRDGAFVPENIRSDGTPTLCTVWIALSDVETSNSCIYVLPRKHDALFQDFIRKKFGQPGIADADKVPLPLPRIRALTAKAGSILAWDQNILHWGSGSSQWAAGPRLSIGVYYQAVDTRIAGQSFDASGRRHIAYENPNCRLSFEDRLRILANNMVTYGHKLDSGAVQEEHYGPLFQSFREKWKWPARHQT